MKGVGPPLPVSARGILGVLTSHVEGGRCERIVCGTAVGRHGSASTPVGLVRMTETGQTLVSVRISNDVEQLGRVMARAGDRPEVVLEATYGWYWAVDALADLGAEVHLAHPLGVKAFEYRRVKNDVRDATDLADLLRMGRLPEAWIAPPEIRELRGLVRHRAKLVEAPQVCCVV
jgi:transposase